jgi:hypothetical protein
MSIFTITVSGATESTESFLYAFIYHVFMGKPALGHELGNGQYQTGSYAYYKIENELHTIFVERGGNLAADQGKQTFAIATANLDLLEDPKELLAFQRWLAFSISRSGIPINFIFTSSQNLTDEKIRIIFQSLKDSGYLINQITVLNLQTNALTDFHIDLVGLTKTPSYDLLSLKARLMLSIKSDTDSSILLAHAIGGVSLEHSITIVGPNVKQEMDLVHYLHMSTKTPIGSLPTSPLPSINVQMSNLSVKGSTEVSLRVYNPAGAKQARISPKLSFITASLEALLRDGEDMVGQLLEKYPEAELPSNTWVLTSLKQEIGKEEINRILDITSLFNPKAFYLCSSALDSKVICFARGIQQRTLSFAEFMTVLFANFQPKGSLVLQEALRSAVPFISCEQLYVPNWSLSSEPASSAMVTTEPYHDAPTTAVTLVTSLENRGTEQRFFTCLGLPDYQPETEVIHRRGNFCFVNTGYFLAHQSKLNLTAIFVATMKEAFNDVYAMRGNMDLFRAKLGNCLFDNTTVRFVLPNTTVNDLRDIFNLSHPVLRRRAAQDDSMLTIDADGNISVCFRSEGALQQNNTCAISSMNFTNTTLMHLTGGERKVSIQASADEPIPMDTTLAEKEAASKTKTVLIASSVSSGDQHANEIQFMQSLVGTHNDIKYSAGDAIELRSSTGDTFVNTSWFLKHPEITIDECIVVTTNSEFTGDAPKPEISAALKTLMQHLKELFGKKYRENIKFVFPEQSDELRLDQLRFRLYHGIRILLEIIKLDDPGWYGPEMPKQLRGKCNFHNPTRGSDACIANAISSIDTVFGGMESLFGLSSLEIMTYTVVTQEGNTTSFALATRNAYMVSPLKLAVLASVFFPNLAPTTGTAMLTSPVTSSPWTSPALTLFADAGAAAEGAAAVGITEISELNEEEQLALALEQSKRPY